MSSFDICSKPRNPLATHPRDSDDKIKTLRKGVFVLGFDKISQPLFQFFLVAMGLATAPERENRGHHWKHL